MHVYSHNIASPARSKRLPAHVRTRPPHDRASVSRSAARALEILERFALEDRPLRAVEIGNAIGLRPSTTMQILKTLVDAGHLLFNAEDKSYFPSPRLVKLGLWLSDRYFGDNRISEILSAVRDASDQYVALFAQNDIYMQIVEHDFPRARPPRAEIGLKVPVFGSACGAALLADLPDAAVHRLMERARVPPGDRGEFLQGLQTAVNDGYAFGGLSPDDETRTVAICLPRSLAGIPLVLAIGGPAGEISANRAGLLAILKRAVADRF
jgi:DNA-binding IclR family transcriptional regulator